MSTFGGLIEDIPGISIDCFEAENLQSFIFFLSHCHTDHMKGLNYSFFERLKRRNQFLYCTSITKKIVENNCDIHDLNVVRVLDTHSPQNLNYKNNNETISITITCIPSGHCPGSVMFILEKDDKSILYTGDFRYNVDDLKKMKVFRSFDGYIKRRFNKVYLDTTFFTKNFPRFPSRKESVTEICKLAKEWFDADEKNVISIESSANYGQEYLYKKLARTFNTKIHVKNGLYKTFVEMPGLSDYVTEDSNVRIHDCNSKKYKSSNLYCNGSFDSRNILVIIPSAICWKDKDTSIISMKNVDRSNARNVCYSMHSSFKELEAFIEHVECDEIIPFVPPVYSTVQEACDLLNNLKKESEKSNVEKVMFNDFTSRSRPKKPYLDSNFKSEYISDDED